MKKRGNDEKKRDDVACKLRGTGGSCWLYCFCVSKIKYIPKLALKMQLWTRPLFPLQSWLPSFPPLTQPHLLPPSSPSTIPQSPFLPSSFKLRICHCHSCGVLLNQDRLGPSPPVSSTSVCPHIRLRSFRPTSIYLANPLLVPLSSPFCLSAAACLNGKRPKLTKL